MERKQQEREQTIARLSAPSHIITSRFEQHEKVEGYRQDSKALGYKGCDRLMKYETIHGSIQLGYDPRKRQSFLFARIKTSILDTAASKHQSQMNELGKKSRLKGEGPNRAFTSRRKANSAVLLYNAHNKPWSAASIRPYLMRYGMEALQKTMPFLRPEQDTADRRKALEKDRELSAGENLVQGEQQIKLRAERIELQAELNRINEVIRRKNVLAHNFFRRVNISYDLQKKKMFAYYRDVEKEAAEHLDSVLDEPPQEGDE